MSITLDKVPPHSAELEVAVIGACLLRNESIDEVMEIINPNDFYIDAHRIIMQAMIHLHSNSRPVDIISLGELLKQHERLDKVGGLSYINVLIDSVPTSANLKSHAEMIKEMSLRRAVLRICLRGVEEGYDTKEDSKIYATGILLQIEEAIRVRVKNPIVSVGETINSTIETIDRQIKEDKLITGIPTGYTDLDKMTAGLQRSDLIIVAGRPSMGKTALALNFLDNAGALGNLGLMFSQEQNVDQLNRRLLSSRSRVECHKLRFPRLLSDNEVGRIIQAANEVKKQPIYVDDSPELTVHDIRSRARRFARSHDLSMIVIDYLQIMRSASRDLKRDLQIAEMTGGLRALAKELDVPVLCISQLNRDCEKREDKRPRKSDLKDSGAIEQDADLILMLYREAAYNFEADDTSEIIIDKNRNGPTGVVKLMFRKELVRFESFIETNEQGEIDEPWYHRD